MGKPNKRQDTGLMPEADAYCAVDNTKCDGACRQKNLENGFVFCNEAITFKQTMSKQDMIRHGQYKRRYYKDADDEYDDDEY